MMVVNAPKHRQCSFQFAPPILLMSTSTRTGSATVAQSLAGLRVVAIVRYVCTTAVHFFELYDTVLYEYKEFSTLG